MEPDPPAPRRKPGRPQFHPWGVEHASRRAHPRDHSGRRSATKEFLAPPRRPTGRFQPPNAAPRPWRCRLTAVILSAAMGLRTADLRRWGAAARPYNGSKSAKLPLFTVISGTRERFAPDWMLRQFTFANSHTGLIGPEKSQVFTGVCRRRPNLGDWRSTGNRSLNSFRLFSPEPRAKRFGLRLPKFFSDFIDAGISPVFRVAALPGRSGEHEVGVAERTGACATNRQVPRRRRFRTRGALRTKRAALSPPMLHLGPERLTVSTDTRRATRCARTVKETTPCLQKPMPLSRLAMTAACPIAAQGGAA